MTLRLLTKFHLIGGAEFEIYLEAFFTTNLIAI